MNQSCASYHEQWPYILLILYLLATLYIMLLKVVSDEGHKKVGSRYLEENTATIEKNGDWLLIDGNKKYL